MKSKKSLKAFIALARTYSYTTEIVKKDIKLYDLSLSEFETLELLFHKGKQPIQKIGQRVLLTSGSMTYVVNQLEKKDMVKRVTCENDKRIIYVQLTSNGESLMQRIFPRHEECIAEIFDALSANELEQLTVLLSKIEKNKKEKSVTKNR